MFGVQILPARLGDPSESSSFWTLAVCDSHEVTLPLLADGSAMDRLEG